MKNILIVISIFWSASSTAQELFKAPKQDVKTRWISPENPTGEKGKAGLTNKGAKGNAFYIIQPGATQILMDVKGAGIIQRMWMSGTIAKNAEQRRAVIINMYWKTLKNLQCQHPLGIFSEWVLGSWLHMTMNYFPVRRAGLSISPFLCHFAQQQKLK